MDTDGLMVNIDTSIWITDPNLNDFHIKMNSVFNTISEWFTVNSLSLNLNKTFYGIKVFRMQKCIIGIMTGYKTRESCRNLLRKLKIVPLPFLYILSILLFVTNNRNQFTINSEIHSINNRQFNNFYQLTSNLSKYQQGLQHTHTHTHTQNCSNPVYVCAQHGTAPTSDQ
jgi:hypothetical protein